MNFLVIIFFFDDFPFFLEHHQPDLRQPSEKELLVYHSDSSNELNDKLDEMLLPASDTDDWDNQNLAPGDGEAFKAIGNAFDVSVFLTFELGDSEQP